MTLLHRIKVYKGFLLIHTRLLRVSAGKMCVLRISGQLFRISVLLYSNE